MAPHRTCVSRAATFLVSIIVTLASSAPAAEKPEVRPLWPGGAPGAKGDGERDVPRIDVYLPPGDPSSNNTTGRTTGRTAVVVCPGGGYGGLALDHEGRQIAQYFDHLGAAAFVLHYRLGSHGYHHPVQLGDVRRAVRTVRRDAEKYGVDAQRIGVMGFSAGGHLASMAGTLFDAGDPDATDPIDRASSRPDFLILGYPVITMDPAHTHKGSRKNLLGPAADNDEAARRVSSELNVTPKTPPTFLFHTDADRAVPAENSVRFYLALRKAGVPAELHVYRDGRHGVGLAKGDPVLATWGDRLRDWLRAGGYLEP